jgi:hypothetical protein
MKRGARHTLTPLRSDFLMHLDFQQEPHRKPLRKNHLRLRGVRRAHVMCNFLQ